MNQMGAATQGKLTEKKCAAEAFTVGHGSPFVAQVSMADEQRLYESILRALEYRGTAFFQAFTTCQPEHGVGDDMASTQARRARDSRGVPQFVYDPQKGETSAEVLDLGGNLEVDRDWREVRRAKDGGKHWYTVAHWATTEARFRRHLKALPEEQAKKLVHLDDLTRRAVLAGSARRGVRSGRDARDVGICRGRGDRTGVRGISRSVGRSPGRRGRHRGQAG